MARWLYSLLFYLATPLLLLRLLWRGRQQPAYRAHWRERWGYYPPYPAAPLIWVHAVSVGETRAAQPLIEGLYQAYPTHRILLTCMTPTGRETGQQLYGDRVLQAYLPYDQPAAVNRFFQHFSIQFGVLMETEIWPNLLQAAHERRLPVVLANARLSARSARGYQRLHTLVRPAFAALSATAAQTPADAERLQALGAVQVHVCGNLKFDVTPPADKLAIGQAWREQLDNRRIFLAASTREGEEKLILQAWQSNPPVNTLLVIVPRHPQRFAEVAEQAEAMGLRVQRRSLGLPDPAHPVWLGDSMGEMAAYYRLADLAYIGGSLLPLGGQNLIEAAACGCPVLIGPHTFNFTQATEDALAAGAAQRIQDADALCQQVHRLLDDPIKLAKMRQQAQEFAATHQGASAKVLALIEQVAAPAGH